MTTTHHRFVLAAILSVAAAFLVRAATSLASPTARINLVITRQ